MISNNKWLFAAAVLFVIAGCGKPDSAAPESTSNKPSENSAQSAPAVQTTPEETVKSFAVAIEQADLKTAASLVKGANPDTDFTTMTDKLKQSAVKLEIAGAKTTTTDSKATVSFDLKISSGGRSVDQKGDVELVQDEGKWLIVPPTEGSFDPTSMLKVYAYSVANVEKLESAWKSRESSNGVAGSADEPARDCLSNVKQLGLGLIMLAADNDDILKLKEQTWTTDIGPYIKSKKLFHCPAEAGEATSYSINPVLVGKSLVSVESPAETVMVYEGSRQKLTFRHDGRAAVCYADGHGKLISEDEAKRLRWKL